MSRNSFALPRGNPTLRSYCIFPSKSLRDEGAHLAAPRAPARLGDPSNWDPRDLLRVSPLWEAASHPAKLDENMVCSQLHDPESIPTEMSMVGAYQKMAL